MKAPPLAIGAILLIAGCQQTDTSRSSVEFDEFLTVDELMHLVIEPSADVLWDSAGVVMTLEGETWLTPTTEEGWLATESAAGVIIESSDLLKMPSRSLDRAESWYDYSSNMAEQAKLARDAAFNQDGDALFEAGASLYQSCLDCHNEYWITSSN